MLIETIKSINMAIKYTIEIQKDLLKVTAKGKDDDMNDAIAYSSAVIQAAIENKSRKVLCDERELEYAISITETYQLAETASKHAINLNKLAIVCDEKSLEDGKFYETVAANRGLIILVTSNFEEALKWLSK